MIFQRNFCVQRFLQTNSSFFREGDTAIMCFAQFRLYYFFFFFLITLLNNFHTQFEKLDFLLGQQYGKYTPQVGRINKKTFNILIYLQQTRSVSLSENKGGKPAQKPAFTKPTRVIREKEIEVCTLIFSSSGIWTDCKYFF